MIRWSNWPKFLTRKNKSFKASNEIDCNLGSIFDFFILTASSSRVFRRTCDCLSACLRPDKISSFRKPLLLISVKLFPRLRFNSRFSYFPILRGKKPIFRPIKISSFLFKYSERRLAQKPSFVLSQKMYCEAFRSGDSSE